MKSDLMSAMEFGGIKYFITIILRYPAEAGAILQIWHIRIYGF